MIPLCTMIVPPGACGRVDGRGTNGRQHAGQSPIVGYIHTKHSPPTVGYIHTLNILHLPLATFTH